MKLKSLLKGLERELYGNIDATEDTEISGICPDSSRIERGNLFVAIKGLKSDGHVHIGEAIEKGAAALVVDRQAVEDGRVNVKDINIPIVICENTRRLISYLFSLWHGEPQLKLKMIGVTGTNGKTSVSRLIYEMFSRSGRKCALVGTVGCKTYLREINIKNPDPNANMTTPDPEQLFALIGEAVAAGCEYAVMEVTSHALHFEKVAPITFDVSVFTNLTEDHLDLHGDMDSYFAAKSKLFSQSRRAVINYDDRYGRLLAEKINIPALLCTMEGRDTGCSAEEIHLLGESGIEYKLSCRDLRLRVRSPLPGRFNVMNTMQAALAVRLLGLSVGEIKNGLAHFLGIEGRLERLKFDENVDFTVYLDYAHTPDALENLIRTARGFTSTGQRIVLLFGCGGDRDPYKRGLMGKIAVEMADMVIITSDNSRSESTSCIIDDILIGINGSCGAPYTVIDDRRLAIEYAIKNARRGDVILLAGKGHEEYELTREGRRRFSEREIAAEFVNKYYG